MVSFRIGKIFLLISTLAVPAAYASHTHRAPTSGHRFMSLRRHKKTIKKTQGQRTIDSDRATEIQTALIHQKYLTGLPTGQWDEQTQAAMRQYQASHGWQTKLTPDSRALISLGLGPKGATETATQQSGSRGSSGVNTSADVPSANTLASVHSIAQ